MALRAVLRSLVLIGVLALVAAAAAAPRLDPVGTFTAPVHVTGPPGDPSRVLVVERAGRVVLLEDGRPRAAPFLDLRGQVSTEGEGGLLSLALDPGWAASGRAYTFSVVAEGGGTAVAIDEFRAAGPDALDPASRRRVITIPHPAGRTNHYGGQVLVTPAGLIIAGIGDGGGTGDPDGAGQDLSVLQGKLIRIDPLGRGQGGYGIPAGNPFAATPGARAEILALGVRNPFRMSLDGVTGDLLVADVGQARVEEVTVLPPDRQAGANLGWSLFEGSLPYPDGAAPVALPGHVPPVIERSHATTDACSITGGVVVRDPQVPALAGTYLYTDLCAGEIRGARLGAAGATGDGPVGLPVVQSPVAIAADGVGRVHVVSIRGPVLRIAEDPPPPVPAPPADPAPPPAAPAPPGPPPSSAPATAAARPPAARRAPCAGRRGRARTACLRARACRLARARGVRPGPRWRCPAPRPPARRR